MTEPQEKQGEGGALLPPSDLEGKTIHSWAFVILNVCATLTG